MSINYINLTERAEADIRAALAQGNDPHAHQVFTAWCWASQGAPMRFADLCRLYYLLHPESTEAPSVALSRPQMAQMLRHQGESLAQWAMGRHDRDPLPRNVDGGRQS